MFDLRSWLRRVPRPHKLRIKVDGEERIIELGEARTRWADCEQTVRSSGATSVEALNEKGAIIRAQKLAEEDVDSPSDADAQAKYDTNLLNRDRQTQASMLDRYGARMSEAFLSGAKAASVSQENLVNLVEILTAHLGSAITNLHNVSVNLANLVSAQADGAAPGDKNDALMGMISAMVTKSLGGAPAPANNGAKK